MDFVAVFYNWSVDKKLGLYNNFIKLNTQDHWFFYKYISNNDYGFYKKMQVELEALKGLRSAQLNSKQSRD